MTQEKIKHIHIEPPMPVRIGEVVPTGRSEPQWYLGTEGRVEKYYPAYPRRVYIRGEKPFSYIERHELFIVRLENRQTVGLKRGQITGVESPGSEVTGGLIASWLDREPSRTETANYVVQVRKECQKHRLPGREEEEILDKIAHERGETFALCVAIDMFPFVPRAPIEDIGLHDWD